MPPQYEAVSRAPEVLGHPRRATHLRVTLRGMSFCIARGAVNGAVFFGSAREQTGLDVTNVARTALSAVLHGSNRE